MEWDRYAAEAALRGWRSRSLEPAGAGAGETGPSAGAGSLLELELDSGHGPGVAWIGLSADGTLRVRAAAGAALPAPAEQALARGPWSPVPAEVREAGDGRLEWVSAATPYRIEIARVPLAIRLVDRRRAIVAELSGLAFGEGRGARIALGAGPGERFFGFGEKRGGLDKRGTRLVMRNRDPSGPLRHDPLYVSVPFFVVHRPGAARTVGSCGLLLECFAPSRFDVAAENADRVAMETHSGGIDATLFPGPTPREVVERFTARTGRTPLPPLWALGHHQSRWSYASAAQVRGLARRIRERGLPTDAVHLDIDHMDGFRVFTWHPKRFPDPKGLVEHLAERGLRVVTIVDPGVKVDPEYPVYREGLERDAFCRRDDGAPYTLRVWPKDAALPDFDRPDVRVWWGGLHRPLVEAGVAGIWNDMNEPAGWARDLRVGRLVVPLRGQDTRRLVQSDPARPERRVPHEQVRNVYGLQHSRATREGLASLAPERRPFVLSRSGYAGIQRYAAVWTGDNASRWSHLRESIPMLLNLSVSGVAFCGADIGGFLGSCTPELYARWMQIGALYPFARTHSAWLGRRQEPWRFGRRVLRIARAALELRMRLLPYLYGLFREAERSGAPVWRPLWYEYPDDPASAEVDDQVLVGPALLAAPVLDRGARERSVYLPPGTWFSWHDDARYTGPRRLRVAAPLERLPLFARAGSVLTTRSPVRHAGERPAEPCVLEVFPGADASLTWVEDDGETTAYRSGALARTALRLWARAGGRLRLEVGPREGAFSLPDRPLRVRVHACPEPRGVTVDGTRIPRGAGVPGFSTREGKVDVRLLDAGRGAAIEIEPAP
jgi:alpha-glucosidase